MDLDPGASSHTLNPASLTSTGGKLGPRPRAGRQAVLGETADRAWQRVEGGEGVARLDAGGVDTGLGSSAGVQPRRRASPAARVSLGFRVPGCTTWG